MTDPAALERDLLEGLLALADRAALEVRVVSASVRRAGEGPRESAACRVNDRIWVVLSPDDPASHQAAVLAGALARHRADFLEAHYVPPAIREFIESVDPGKR